MDVNFHTESVLWNVCCQNKGKKKMYIMDMDDFLIVGRYFIWSFKMIPL